jgi:hypothetical protein
VFYNFYNNKVIYYIKKASKPTNGPTNPIGESTPLLPGGPVIPALMSLLVNIPLTLPVG